MIALAKHCLFLSNIDCFDNECQGHFLLEKITFEKLTSKCYLDERLKREQSKVKEEKVKLDKEVQREQQKLDEDRRGLTEDRAALGMLKVLYTHIYIVY